MAQAGTITVDAVLQSAQFAGQIERLERRIGGLEGTFTRTSRNITRGFQEIGSAIAGGLIANQILQIVNAVDQLGDRAQQLDVTAESLQGLRLAADDFGGSAEGLDRALGELQKNLGEAITRGGAAADAFERIGLSARELNGLAVDEVFFRVATAIAEQATQAERAAIAQEFFGRSGRELVPLLSEGREGVEALIASYREAGLVLSNNTVDALGDTERQLRLTKTAVSNLAAEVVTVLSPAIEGLANILRDGVGDIRVIAGIDLNRVEELNRAIEERQRALNSVEASVRASVRKRYQDEIDVLAELQQAEFGRAVAVRQFDEEIAARAAEREKNLAAIFAPVVAGFEKDIENALKRNQKQPSIYDLDPTLKQRTAEGSFQGALDAQTEAALRQTNDRVMQIVQEGELAKRQAYQETAAYQVQLREEAEQASLNVQSAAINAGIGLLQTLAGRSKAAAVAMVLVNKSMSIAQAIQNTAVAVTAAMKYDPTGALAARVAALGKVQIGLIAATGIGEIANIGSGDAGGIGGTTLGTPNNPIYANNQSGASSPFEQKVVRVEVVGRLTDGAGAAIAELVAKEIKERDIVIIEPGSRQAREIVGPGG